MAYEHAVVLTGGIATGKSSAGALLKLFGFRIIDADAIAHEILDREAARIAERFGEEMLAEGRVDRRRLGERIFADPEERKALEAIVHPPIREEILRRSEEQESLGKPYLIDIPLFFETGRDYPITRSVVVYAPRPLQLARLMKRDKLDEAEALQRLDAQLDIEEKRRRATWVIDNSGDLAQLSAECERVKEEILRAFS